MDNSTAGVLRSLENLKNLNNLKNLEKSGNFSDQGSFRSLVVFTHSLSIQMRNHFLGLPRTTWKNLKKVGKFLKFGLESLEKSGNRFENCTENPVLISVGNLGLGK